MRIIRSTWFKLLSDKSYIKLKYFIFFHKKINLVHPITYNEKLNWLKLYDRKDSYTSLVDKYLVKEYVSKIIGEDHIIPTIGIYDHFEDIDFDKLPDQFVLKCTHDSGGIVICKDKSNFDIAKAKDKIKKRLRNNYYYDNREWPYKNVKPRIIIEKYMEDLKTKELRDYKFFCFNGQPRYMFVATDRSTNQTKFNFYDMDFKLQDVKQHYPNDERNIKKPICFKEMKKLAEKLSKDIPHVRVDFYEINGKIYFGELTFSHFGGFVPFEPEEWDEKLGELIDISKVEGKK